MSQKADYFLYPSLIDAYINFDNYAGFYETYYSRSDKSPEHVRESLKSSLINSINRVFTPNWYSERGNAFNNLIDYLMGNNVRGFFRYVYIEPEQTYIVTRSSGSFAFPARIIDAFVEKFTECMVQHFTSAYIDTDVGRVNIYGFIDVLNAFSIHDIKLKKKLMPRQFYSNCQHLIYTYCIYQQTGELLPFYYDKTDLIDIQTEHYQLRTSGFDRIRRICEGLIGFVNENRDLITDTKIFDGKNV